MKASKSAKSESKKKKISTPFEFEANFKNEIDYFKKWKFKCYIRIHTEKKYGDRIYYKVYIRDTKKTKYLMENGLKKLSKQIKIKTKSNLSDLCPPLTEFHVVVSLFSYKKRIASFLSEKITVKIPPLADLIRLKSISSISKSLIPHNPLVIWMTLEIDPLFHPVSLIAQQELSTRKENLLNRNHRLSLVNSTKNVKIQKIPLKITVPEIPGKISKVKYSLELYIQKDNEPLLNKEKTYSIDSILSDIRYKEVKYKKDISLNQISYMIGEFKNDTAYKVKGKTKFHFITSHNTKLECFSRKFKIQSNNFEIVSEDIQLPAILGGYSYWVCSQAKLKAKAGKMYLENISDKRKAKITTAQYFVKMKALIRSKPIKPRDIITVGIDFRTRAQNPQKSKILIQILLNYENIDEQVIYETKFKRDFHHFDFKWKVPRQYGKMQMEPRIFVNDILIHPQNLDTESVDFIISPF